MQALNLPTYSFKIKSEGESFLIFDEFRKKNVILSPEEWVRQNFARFLTEGRGVPAGRIVIEKSLSINKLTKRCDILVYGNSEPLILVECKAPEVKITQAVFDQIAVYNMHFKLKYLIVTNGLDHYCGQWDDKAGSLVFLEDIPFYNSINI
ncbi:MAG: type I restriction enzyme HsdR N-terminal domain-containing protein [Bacteroidales bacterium]|nr:type I restriction enzyme HsdR N-terminal domain-containing protein [Bacteroidales bacterium]MCF8391341.1 type I restriction enzyme HsdR N-terminal domain-containing protein [Bacteroidales bacterium]